MELPAHRAGLPGEVGFARDFTDQLIPKDGDFPQYCISHVDFCDTPK